ncbi:hypothetical protein CC80DRAFT_535754 [Byssothecium circinans]|uniref:Zn(2)-C6 fungal-type domain-containing protein n=1 Tax=Byssothecium circinans TaxID=147558 RepID=A0A6A5TY94_9PLEO|nr:hypothetical protein CC80DRAFT_535754 [Byssothecium circinans]
MLAELRGLHGFSVVVAPAFCGDRPLPTSTFSVSPSSFIRLFPTYCSANYTLMSAIATGRSCSRCYEAKRKCDQMSPSCRLCRRKGLACVYPSRRPSSFVPIETIDPYSLPPSTNLPDLQTMSNELSVAGISPELSLDFANPTDLLLTNDARAAWFTAPEAFIVDHSPMPLPPNFKIQDLKEFVRLIESWLTIWVTTGSNAFIHAHLYGNSFPSCLQIAFATYSAYINRTPTASEIILRSVNDQATALVSELDQIHGSKDLVKDLAYIHALFAYQMIGLFDGDIRSRHLAESRAPVLAELLDRTLKNASATLKQEMSMDGPTFSLAHLLAPTELLWRSWIISESLRRTWLVIQGISASYDGLKQGWAPCNGDVMFTTREGLWSADSASVWAKMSNDEDVRFVGRTHAECLFTVAPEETDEFAKFMLENIFGKERSSNWLSGTRCVDTATTFEPLSSRHLQA